MKPQSHKDYVADIEEMAKRSFARHQILRYTPGPGFEGSWLVGEPHCSIFRAQVIVTYDCSIIVHGDIDVVCFQRYHGGPNTSPAEVIAWMATSSIDYVTEKANIGTGREVTEDYDAGVALDNVLWHIREAEKEAAPDEDDENGNLDEYAVRDLALWNSVKERLEDGDSKEEIRQYIYDETHDADLTNIGEVTSARVIWAWMMVRKLHELLIRTDSPAA